MKVYIEMNNLQVELIGFRKKNIDFIHVYFREAMDSMQYRPPNAHLESGSQTAYIVSVDNECRHLLVVGCRI